MFGPSKLPYIIISYGVQYFNEQTRNEIPQDINVVVLPTMLSQQSKYRISYILGT